MRQPTLFTLCCCLFSLAAQAHTYVESSALSNGNIVKLQIQSTGLYSLSYEQIQSYGLNPQKVRLLGYGGNVLSQDLTRARMDDVPSVPFYMHVGEDGVFSPGDYIIFYANGPVGWEWNNSSQAYARTRNWYADYGCYFISDDAGEQLIMSIGDTITSAKIKDVYTYTALQLHELDQVNLVDYNNGKEGGGREWYGEKMTVKSNELTIPFSFTDVDKSGLHTMYCRVDMAANSQSISTMKVKVAQTTKTSQIPAISLSDFYTRAETKSAILTPKPVSDSLPVALTYTSSDNTAIAYLNYIEMQVPCYMRLRGNYLYIRNTEAVGTDSVARYHLLGADTNTQIWNMTTPTEAYIVPTTWSGDTLCWLGTCESPELYIAVRTNVSKWETPASRGRITNQNVHKQVRGKQHIIITPENFRYAAEQLKQAHELYSSEKWCVVSDEEVYNEFSSGTPDASAYRWLMKYMYDTNDAEQAPRSLLLFGDGSFDNRKLISTSAMPYLLTYQASNSTKETDAYATDDFFGWMEEIKDATGSKWDDLRARMQISVGRLPIRTQDEAEGVVTKLITYLQNSTAGSWEQQVCFLADDGDQGTHTISADMAAEAVSEIAPDFVINKIYLDSYIQETTASGESYPLAYNTFCNLLKSGILFMDYCGHGSANNICSEMFLTRKQVEAMVNANLGLWALATCSFAHFDQTAQSTAELAVLNNVGGALAVISSDRTVYASENEKLNKYLCEHLFEHTDPFTYPNSIGDALRLAKNENGDNMNKLPYVLLGDPAIQLHYPCQYQAIISYMPDTLRALDTLTIRGYISNMDTLSSARRDTVNYNGNLSITIYDKQQTIATHDNDELDQSKKRIFYFHDYPYKIFAGGANIENGKFEIKLRVPKDIRYNLGAGRLTMYAIGEDEKGVAKAMGHYEQFMVGGSSPWIIDDNEGPDMHIYLNTPLFTDGDRVNTTPHFYADLSDVNGINTAGSGIGHDLQLIIDNSPKQTYILNNYYTADNNSYQSGTVSYILPEMTNGRHELSFRAWDLLNNATTQTIGFVVDSTQGPSATTMLVYPTPVSQFGILNMLLTNDRPDDLLSIDIAFYTMAGQKIWSTYRSIYGTNLEFDMQEAGLTPGSYVYQFTIQTTTQTSVKYSGRLIVY